ncbi:MAG: hypothetical protein WBG26_08865, partial [Candidatus Binataceae bacterium]
VKIGKGQKSTSGAKPPDSSLARRPEYWVERLECGVAESDARESRHWLQAMMLQVIAQRNKWVSAHAADRSVG